MRGQQLGGLVGGEGQLGRPDLGQLPAEPPAVQRQRRVGTPTDDQAQPVTGMPQQEVEPTGHARVVDPVEVVQDQRDRLGTAGQLGGEVVEEAGSPPRRSRCRCREPDCGGRRPARPARCRWTGPRRRRYDQSRPPPSPGSSESQARDPPSARTRYQELSSIVLPQPAGAETRVTGPAAPVSRSAKSRGRATTAPDSGATASLEVSSGSAAGRPASALAPQLTGTTARRGGAGLDPVLGHPFHPRGHEEVIGPTRIPHPPEFTPYGGDRFTRSPATMARRSAQRW